MSSTKRRPSLSPLLFRPLMVDPHVEAALQQAWDRDARMRIVEDQREAAIRRLADAVRRVPAVPERIADRYRAEGRPVPQWNLANDDDAVRFTLALPRRDPTPDESEAARLLRACVLALEHGDVEPFAGLRELAEHRAASERVTARARAAAKAERPARHDKLREALVTALRRHRHAGRTLKEALGAMRDAPQGLRVCTTSTGYTVTDESAQGKHKPRAFAPGTLGTLWTEAGKAKAKRR